MYRKFKTNFKQQKKPETIIDDDNVEADVSPSNLKQKKQIIHLSRDDITCLIERLWQEENSRFVYY